MIVNKYQGNGGGGGGSYVLPPATANRLGGIKVGSGLTVQNDGTLSASGSTYELPVASDQVLGGVKVGSGLTIANDGTLSASGSTYELPVASDQVLGGVKVGSGLTIDSGGTLSVSGGTQGGGQVFYIDNVYGTYQDLANLLFSYWDDENSVISSAYPADDIHIYLWLGQNFQGAFDTPTKGYIELFPDSVYEDGIDIMNLTGVYANGNNGELTAYSFKYGLRSDGNSQGNWTAPIFNFDFSRYVSYCRFGNDGRGYLTYDADNDRFEYDSGYIATGDTANAYEDLVDWLLTTQGLVDGGLIFNYICVQNLNKFFVIENGETMTYTHPALGFKELASPYTIGDWTFGYEITYRYSDWILKIDLSEGSNVGANLRITAI